MGRVGSKSVLASASNDFEERRFGRERERGIELVKGRTAGTRLSLSVQLQTSAQSRHFQFRVQFTDRLINGLSSRLRKLLPTGIFST